jgi:tetratricopeptide (TPR) repeat protein
VARASLNLATIQARLGKTDEAMAGFTKSIEWFSELLVSNSGGATIYRERLIKARSSLASLVVKNGHYEKVVSLPDPSEMEASFPAVDSPGTIAGFYLSKAEALRHLGRIDEAKHHLMKVFDLVDGAVTNPIGEAAKATQLSRAHFERGCCRLLEHDLESSAADHIQAVEILLKLLEQNPASQTYRYELGRNYSALGETLAESGLWTDAGRAQTEAVKYLKELVEASPEVVRFKITLARSYAVVAGIQRDRDASKSAMEYQKGAIKVFEDCLSRPGVTDVHRAELAKERGVYAELFSETEEPVRGIEQAQKGIRELEVILAKQAGGVLKKKNQRRLAHLYATLGDVAERADQREEAMNGFRRAIDLLKLLADSDHSEAGIDKELDRCKERLAKLESPAGEQR